MILDTSKDVTGVHYAGAGYGHSYEELQLVIESVGMGIWSYDPANGVVTADERLHRIFGSSSREGLVAYWLSLIHPDDRQRVGQRFTDALAGKVGYEVEYRIVRPDGERWLRSRGRVHWEDGTPVRMFALVEDITVRKRTEEALRTSEEAMRLAQQAGGIATWDWDVETGRFQWSPGGSLVYGRPVQEISHIDQILTYVHEDDREAIAAGVAPALAGKAEFQTEFRVRWPDNSIHWLIGRGQPILSAEGKPIRIVGINLDVTDRRKAEAALRQNEKLAAVGRLASSIAHEINNPLESVTNLLFLARRSGDLDEIHEYMDTAERELRRISLITNQTLRFHRQSTKPSAFLCSDLIGDGLSIYQGRLINSGIEVEKRKRVERPVHCFGGEIRQVLSNLIGNAIDAMPMGGRLLVRSREATNWKTGAKGLVVTVGDTGTGISPATTKKIFEPFFTTKGIGGTGLGLWISSEIVGRHQGELRIRSSQKEGASGTVFTLFLPFEGTLRSASSELDGRKLIA